MRAWTVDADVIRVAEDFDESLLYRTPEIEGLPRPRATTNSSSSAPIPIRYLTVTPRSLVMSAGSVGTDASVPGYAVEQLLATAK